MSGDNNKGNICRPSAVGIWATAFGCVIGWGCFVMPGTTFLPEAGPLGTIIGIAIAAVIILIVGADYSILSGRYPEARGSYSYVNSMLGSDYAFLTAWALEISYVMLFWANSTAFVLIGRFFFGNILQWGLHYTVAGYDVYLGEVIATICIELIFGLIVLCSGRITYMLRVILGVMLFAGVMVLFIGIAVNGGISIPAPVFSEGETRFSQIVSIAVLAPWMFVGFETIYHDAGKEGFQIKRTNGGAIASIIAGMLVYAFLALIAVSGVPEGCSSWADYIGNLDSFDGLDAVPVFFNIRRSLGEGGVALAVVTVFCALATGVLGFMQSAVNLLQTLAGENIMPEALGTETNGIPRRAVISILLLSLPVPFLGRTSICWLVDVSTLAVAIVYAHISICAFRISREENNKTGMTAGMAGALLSVASFIFLLIPNIFAQNALTAETYFMLAVWSLAGVVYYWYILQHDNQHRFGKSTVMWIMMIALLFIAVILWIALDTHDRASAIGAEGINHILTRNSIIEVGLVAVVILVIFSLFSTMMKREREMDMERVRAEESNRAKTAFLFNMSHDIRTPMNAIIGYTSLAMQEDDVPEAIAEYLKKIDISGHHLLALINDVLEMSRIESGKMELETAPSDLVKMVTETGDLFSNQTKQKEIDFSVDTSDVRDRFVVCDKNRLNRVLLNLVSNACKFTPEGGAVKVTLRQSGDDSDGMGHYEFRVKDNGIGMSGEFAGKVFDPFERERTSTISEIQGTGLGMAITKSIVDLMGGTIEVITAPRKGTEFIVNISFELARDHDENEGAQQKRQKPYDEETDFSNYHLLLVEDNDINREIAVRILTATGFTLDTAVNGQEAVETIAASQPGYYDLVLMDIQMPVMNGYEATRAIRALDDAELSGVPIVAMTANAFAEDKKDAEDAGMNAHIAKPIDIETMMETIQNVLNERYER